MNERHESAVQRATRILIRYRWILLCLAVATTALATFPASKLTYDESIEALYRPDDPYLLDYAQSKSLFGGDELLMVAYHDPELRSADGFDRIREFSDRLSAVPGVQTESSQNFAEAMSPKKVPFFFRLVLRTRTEDMRALSEKVLVSSDDRTTAIVLRLQPESETEAPRAETFAKLRELADDHDPRAYVVGEPILVHDMYRLVEVDGELLFRVSLGLLGLVILVLFRSLRWVALPITVVVVTIIWTKALLVLSGLQLSMVSSMLNSLMTIVGIATVMHVTVHYRECRRSLDRIDSLQQTITELAPAVFWTCATTAAGFAALLSSGIAPVRSFGTMMSLGTMLVLFASAAVLPGGILWGRRDADPQSAPAERKLVGLLAHTIDAARRHRIAVFAVSVIVALFAASGFPLLEVETDFSKNFRKSSVTVQSLDFVETQLGGAALWEVNFPAPQELTPEFMDRVRSLTAALRGIGESEQDSELTKVVALTDILDILPGTSSSTDAIRRKLDRIAGFQPEYEPGLFNPEQGRMRLVLRARERQQSERKVRLIDTVRQLAVNEFETAKTTGPFVLLTHLIESLLHDQLVSFAIAAAAISGMMSVAFRSLRIGAISLVPNLLPIVLLVGTIGWIGLPINIGTAMIASVSIGLTTDSTIHYISSFRRARRRGLSLADALRETHQGVGRAVVFATLSLVVGFSVLSISNFIPMVYFGVLVSIAMLGGLVGDLVLLPLMLPWAEKSREGDIDSAENSTAS
jgi:hypothetical protein